MFNLPPASSAPVSRRESLATTITRQTYFKTESKTPAKIEAKASVNPNEAGKQKDQKKYGLGPELQDHQKRELKRAFKVMDPRGVGLVNSTSLLLAFRAICFEPSLKQFEKMLKKEYGEGMDSMIDFKRFYTMLEKQMLLPFSRQEAEVTYKDCSDPKAGGITFEKLEEISEELGHQDVTTEEIKMMITFADLDKDGVIGLNEFKQVLKRPLLE